MDIQQAFREGDVRGAFLAMEWDRRSDIPIPGYPQAIVGTIGRSIISITDDVRIHAHDTAEDAVECFELATANALDVIRRFERALLEQTMGLSAIAEPSYGPHTV